MGYVDDILNWHAENTVTNDEMFGDVVILAPAGDWDNKVNENCVVIADHAQGSNEVQGDGVRMERPGGRTVRDSISVEFKVSAEIQRVQSRQHPDEIKWDGVIWSAQRTTGWDDAMRTVLFVRTKDVLRRGETKRG